MTNENQSSWNLDQFPFPIPDELLHEIHANPIHHKANLLQDTASQKMASSL